MLKTMYNFLPKNKIAGTALLLLLLSYLVLSDCIPSIIKVKESKAHLYAGHSVLDHLPKPVPEMKMRCNKIGDPEFHSLRPYQAAPCGDSEKTLFCWNNYLLIETLKNQWDPEKCQPCAGCWQCETDASNEEIEKIYGIDGEYARFPIMGNTEQVRNSQN